MELNINWSRIPNISTSLNFKDICYSNGIFVTITDTEIYTSYDCKTWTLQYTASTTLKSICYGNGQFVIVASGLKTYTSIDACLWTKNSTIGMADTCTSVRYGDGKYVALASSNIYYSSDAITWSVVTPYQGEVWTDLCYGNGKYIVVGVSASNPDICTSPDLVNWTPIACPANKDINSCCQGYGIFVATAEDTIVISVDAYTWTVSKTFPGVTFKYVRFGNGVFVAIGSNGTIVSSKDGVNWTENISMTTDDLNACCYGSDIFVVVGTYGRILTSGFKSANIGKIKILTPDLIRTCIIKDVIKAEIVDELNGEYTLSFTAELDKIKYEYLTEDSILEIFGTYFDVVYLKKESQEDGTCIVEVESEHVSYRLNNPAYNIGMFGEYGTPEYVLSKILEGTDFAVDNVEFTDTTTHAIYEPKSRRQLVMEFIALLGGEITYSGFSIGISKHRGSTSPTIFRTGKNISVITKTIDKRQKDQNGNALVNITCTPLILADMTYKLGDNVTLIDSGIGVSRSTLEQARNSMGELLYWMTEEMLNTTTTNTGIPVMQPIQLRIVKYTLNPYTEEVTFEISNSINPLADSLYRIETQAVVKDTKYNGIRIGPQYGFEAVRNDQKARAYFRSDQMAFQVGDGSGDPNMWQDKLFYDYDSETGETILVFAGTFTADVIDALSALISPNLYAGKAYISELTVDSLETSTKVQKYLASDTSDVNYVRIYAQTIKFITARCSANFSPAYVSSGTMSETSGIAIYYTGMLIDEDTGAIKLVGGTQQQISAGEAFNSGYVYRSIDADSYYKFTGSSGGDIHYSIYSVAAQSGTTEQAKNANNELLYWVDDTHTGATTDELDSQGDPLAPVMVYIYNELVKQSITFTYDAASGEYLPVNVLGAGSGETEIAGQGRLLKRTDGVALEYTTRDGDDTCGLYLRDDGFADITGRRANVQIDTTAKTITVSPEGSVSPVVISYNESGDTLYLTWPDDQIFSVSKV